MIKTMMASTAIALVSRYSPLLHTFQRPTVINRCVRRTTNEHQRHCARWCSLVTFPKAGSGYRSAIVTRMIRTSPVGADISPRPLSRTGVAASASTTSIPCVTCPKIE